MLCPSDNNNTKPFNGSAVGQPAAGDGWARGNYGVNGSLGAMNGMHCQLGRPSSSPARTHSGWAQSAPRHDGPQRVGHMADVMDGASNTIMLGEIRAGVNEIIAGSGP